MSSWGQGGQGQRGEGHREQRGKGREHGRVHPVRDHLPAADTCRHLCTAAAAAPAQSGSAGGGGLTCGVYCGVVGASPCTSLSNGIAGLLQYLKNCLEPSLTSGSDTDYSGRGLQQNYSVAVGTKATCQGRCMSARLVGPAAGDSTCGASKTTVKGTERR